MQIKAILLHTHQIGKKLKVWQYQVLTRVWITGNPHNACCRQNGHSASSTQFVDMVTLWPRKDTLLKNLHANAQEDMCKNSHCTIACVI